MSFYQSLFHQPISVFPDRMLNPREGQGTAREIAYLVTGLFLLTLVPRVITAWHLGSVCNDAHYYIWLADSLEQGDIKTAVVSYLNLNIYPIILMLIHKLGIDWITGGKIWGVLVSSLMIFPMFGWVREQYNEQIATVACLLYAVHPELIEWSAEPIREPTFWFLATCVVYFMWRSVMGLKILHFVLAGILLAFAIHTRVEGWLLVALLVVWTFLRFRLLAAQRKKLLFGSILSLAMIPLFIIVMNVTLLRNYSQWEFGRTRPFVECFHWASTTLGLSDQPLIPPGVDATRSADATLEMYDVPHPVHPRTLMKTIPLTKWELLMRYQKQFFSSMGTFALAFLGIGLLVKYRAIIHRDKCMFLPLMLILMFGIWIRFSSSSNMSGRFFLLAYLLVIPCGAIGFLFLMSQLSQRFSKNHHGKKTLRPLVVSILVMSLTAIGWADSLSSSSPHRKSQVQFGIWLKENYGNMNVIVTETKALRTGYAVNSEKQFNSNLPNDLWGLVDRKQPEMVIVSSFSNSDSAKQWRSDITKFFAQRSMSPISMQGAPKASSDFLVFIKTDIKVAKNIKPAKRKPVIHTASR